MYERIFTLTVATLLLSSCSVAEDIKPEVQVAAPVQEVVAEISQPASVEEVQLFTEPWPEVFSRKQLGDTAQMQIEKYFSENFNPDCDLTGHRYSEGSLPEAEQVDEVLNEFIYTFCDELQEDPFLITGRYFFAKEVLDEQNRQTDDHGGICGQASSGGSTGCALFHSVWIKDSLSDAMMVGVAAHELFHIVQDSVNVGQPTWRTPRDHELYVPMWFIEGAAVTYQAAVVDHLGFYDYYDFDGTSYMLMNDPKTRIDMTLIEEGWHGDVYVVGQFATEYLVANLGFGVLLDVLVDRGHGVPFTEAFEANVGMSLDAFYEKMSAIKLVD